MQVTRVFNFKASNGLLSEVADYTLDPHEAVIAAHAQSRGDWNTWGYGQKYGHLVRIGHNCVTCGDFTAIAIDAAISLLA